MPSTKPKLIAWIAQILAAAIMGQTLFFKFSGHPDSIAIFSELGVEPWGRYTTGIIEVLACLLLLAPRTAIWGAILGAGVMAGAILGHLAQLGFEGERGQLASLAVIVLLSCLAIVYLRRAELPFSKKGVA
ncbi:DoxX family protein [Pelagicoccus sp. SDUM812003]|uniref:DoxX family protein n=1 Tax=Pelagicoccus sp. SDUM812003 TaxID=3041267 RepID=UPI00280D1EB4|nr:DoxX family protein [Pelagicoccus sp. SDUM812003]MDQ8205111.1 DoxX family protein [Pelagicoccus sp. SDUM812003]